MITLSISQVFQLLTCDWSWDQVSLVRYPWLVEQIKTKYSLLQLFDEGYYLDLRIPTHPILYHKNAWMRERQREERIRAGEEEHKKTWSMREAPPSTTYNPDLMKIFPSRRDLLAEAMRAKGLDSTTIAILLATATKDQLAKLYTTYGIPT